MSRVRPAIFREYDIRGTVDADLDPAAAFLVGKGRRGTTAKPLGRG